MSRSPSESAVGLSRSGTPSTILAASKLTVWYGDTMALREVSVEFPRNLVTAIIGPTGCGKSTLLRSLNRMNDLIPGTRTAGSIRLEGEEILGRDPAPIRRRVGMIFSRPNPFPKSIYQNVAWGARINGYSGDLDELVETSLRRSGLWDEVKSRLNRTALELGPGQQQRLCIARTLAVGPEVILMDEPCIGLDPIATARVEDLIDDLKSSHTIVIVTHNLQQARRVSDWTACMMLDDLRPDAPASTPRPGVLAEISPTARLFTNPRDARTEAYITGRIG